MVAELTALVQDNPLHERFHAQLIIALYRCGRQADVLQAYKQARRVLLEELASNPSRAARGRSSYLYQDPALAAPASTAPERTPIDGVMLTAHDGLATRFPLVGRNRRIRGTRRRSGLCSRRTRRRRPSRRGARRRQDAPRRGDRQRGRRSRRDRRLGRCYEGRGAPAFWPWVQVIGHLLDRYDRTAVADALRTTAGDLAPMVPAVKEFVANLEPPPPEDPESARFRLGQAITTTLRRLARHQPLVVVLDDLHCADPAVPRRARRPGRHDRRHPDPGPGTFRDVDVSHGLPLADTLVELSRRPTTRRHDLSGLDITSLARLSP